MFLSATYSHTDIIVTNNPEKNTIRKDFFKIDDVEVLRYYSSKVILVKLTFLEKCDFSLNLLLTGNFLYSPKEGEVGSLVVDSTLLREIEEVISFL